MSRGGTVLAIGAPRYMPQVTKGDGVVFVYDLVSGAWVQRGGPLYPNPATSANYGEFGKGVALSNDGTYLAVGAPDETWGTWVRVYQWVVSAWTERYTITGAGGDACAISADGSILAVGTVFNGTGNVKIYDWNGSAYVQRGSAILPPTASSWDGFGRGVALNSAGTVLAVASNSYDGGYYSNGGVHLYDWNGSAWIPRPILAADYYVQADDFGASVALNSDASVVAVGAPGLGDTGAVIIFDAVSGGWNRRGAKLLNHSSDGNGFGRSVALSGDALRLVGGGTAVTLPGNNYSGFAYDFIPGTAVEVSPLITWETQINRSMQLNWVVGAVTVSASMSWDLASAVDQSVLLRWGVLLDRADALLWRLQPGSGVGYVPTADFVITDAPYIPTTDFTLSAENGIVKSTQLAWSLSDPVAQSKQLLWDVLQSTVKSYQLQWGIEAAASYRINFGIVAQNTTRLAWRLQLGSGSYVPTTDFVISDEAYIPTSDFTVGAGQGDIVQSVQLMWSLAARVTQSTALTWDILQAIQQSTAVSWSPKLFASARVSWGIAGVSSTRTTLSWDLTATVGKPIRMAWAVLDHNPAKKPTRLVWQIDPSLPTLVLNTDTSIVIEATQRRLTHDNIRISRDVDSWLQSFSADILDISDWQALAGNPEVTISIGAYAWKMRVEGRNKSLGFGSQAFSISGRSRSAVLAKGVAVPVNQEWTSTTAKTIIQTLCDAAGIALNFQIPDWPLTAYSANARYPIDIISELVQAPGAVLYTADDSTLLVLPAYKAAPSRYAESIPDAVINSNDDELQSSHRYIQRDDYDSIDVGNESAGSENQLSVSLKSEPHGAGIKVRIYVVPFKKLTLQHSATGHLALVYRGIKTEKVTETIEIIEGKGSLSGSFYGLQSTSWRYANLGSVSILEDGTVTSSVKGQSLVEITYTTKWIEYDASSSDDLAQVYIED